MDSQKIRTVLGKLQGEPDTDESFHVFDPDARLQEVIAVPEDPANFAWGGDDYRSLFITASTSLYRVRRRVPGLPPF